MHRIFFKHVLLIIFLFTCNAVARAQDPFREFKMTHWDSKKGMPNDLVLSIFQTSDGFIWLTGYFGLARFDGSEFAHFSSKTEPLFTSDGFVSVLVESSDTALWIATPGSGLLRYKQGKFQAFLTDKANLFVLGVVNEDDLLIAVGNSSQEFIVFNARTKKSSIIPPEERDAWFAKRLLTSTRPSASNNIASGRLGLPKVLNRNGVLDTLNADNGTLDGLAYSSILSDSKGRIWLGSDQGLFTLDEEKLKPFPGMQGQSLAPISPTRGLIVEDDQKGIWGDGSRTPGLPLFPPVCALGAERGRTQPLKERPHGKQIDFMQRATPGRLAGGDSNCRRTRIVAPGIKSWKSDG
jgi:hypothetical protein